MARRFDTLVFHTRRSDGVPGGVADSSEGRSPFRSLERAKRNVIENCRANKRGTGAAVVERGKSKVLFACSNDGTRTPKRVDYVVFAGRRMADKMRWR